MMKDEAVSDYVSRSGKTGLRQFLGKVIRRQENLGLILVVARAEEGIEIVEDAKRLFPKDGCVALHGAINAGLSVGDWVAFDIARNPTRPGAPTHKAVHLSRLPHFAALPEQSPSGHRMHLTKTGWRGDQRAGVWALKISTERVIVTELVSGPEGGLRIPRESAQRVNWFKFSEDLIAELPTADGKETVFIGDYGKPSGTLDWSDEVDYVAKVIRSLSDANDPRVDEVIAWLELHHDEAIGRVSTADIDHETARIALRSGEVAERLKADRDLMADYVNAVTKDENIRIAIAQWSREGYDEESRRLREGLALEIERKREDAIARLKLEMAGKRTVAIDNVAAEVAKHKAARLDDANVQLQKTIDEYSKEIELLEAKASERREILEQSVSELQSEVSRLEVTLAESLDQIDQANIRKNAAIAAMDKAEKEIDRLLAIGGRLSSQDLQKNDSNRFQPALSCVFHDRVQVSAKEKGNLISRSSLLTEHGKNLLREITVLMLAGELPILVGKDAQALTTVIELLLCPGRSTSIEADETMISLEDLLSRPGSGAPTPLAAASLAAAGEGAVIVTIRGIERSAARIWHPALAEALRSAGLPRGLLAVCVANDFAHEEIAALPNGKHLIHVEGALEDSAHLVGASLLSPPNLKLETIDVGEGVSDLTAASLFLLKLGFKLPFNLSLRIARIYMEALGLLGDEDEAEALVRSIAHRMAVNVGIQVE